MINSHKQRNAIMPWYWLCVSSGLMLLSGCAQHYTVSTNVDRENFEQYFAPSQVTVYHSVAELPVNAKYLGLVEGEDCQLQAHHAIPEHKIARTQARTAAYQKRANAVVFTGCTFVPSKQCHQQLVCFGQAYQISAATSGK
jgi:RcsF protein